MHHSLFNCTVIDVPNGVNGIHEHDEINRLTQYLKQHKNISQWLHVCTYAVVKSTVLSDHEVLINGAAYCKADWHER